MRTCHSQKKLRAGEQINVDASRLNGPGRTDLSEEKPDRADKRLNNRAGETSSPKDRIERPISLITNIIGSHAASIRIFP